jgi:hypothetical protein
MVAAHRTDPDGRRFAHAVLIGERRSLDVLTRFDFRGFRGWQFEQSANQLGSDLD